MGLTLFAASHYRMMFGCALVIAVSLLFVACGSSDGVPEPGESTQGNPPNSNLNQVFQADVGSDILLSLADIDGLDSLINSGQNLAVNWRIVSPLLDSAQPQAAIANSQSNTARFVAYVVGDFVIRVSAAPAGNAAAEVSRNIGVRVSLLADATIKPNNHINSSDACFNCHSQLSWTKPKVSHDEVVGSCSSCHDGQIARGVGAAHIQLNNLECDTCHITSQWFGNTFPDAHDAIVTNCIACHDDVSASGKPYTHINSTDVCQACHSNTAWVPVAMVDHQQVIGSCDSCHNGYVASGKPVVHMPTSNACVYCHDVPPAAWAPLASIDHTQTLSQICEDCHDGVVATGKSSIHKVTQEACDVCHVVTSWTTIKAP